MKNAEPMTLLVWRYIFVVVLLVPFYLALKPPLPNGEWTMASPESPNCPQTQEYLIKIFALAIIIIQYFSDSRFISVFNSASFY